MKKINSYKVLLISLFSLLIVSCGQSLPECSSDEVKSTLLKIIKDQVNREWFLEQSFDTINTENKSDSKIQCQTQMIFKFPSIYGDPQNKKMVIQYDIQKNETEKGSFSVLAKTNFDEIERFNHKSWLANQKYFFKKADIEFLSEEWIVENANTGKISYNDALSYVFPEKIKSRLIDKGWKFDGSSDGDKSIWIFTKENYLLNVKVTINGIDVSKTAIWEEK